MHQPLSRARSVARSLPAILLATAVLAGAFGGSRTVANAAGTAPPDPASGATADTTAQNASALVPGDPAPPFVAHGLDTGRQIDNADFAGKILVVNFWATWCPPCRAETPDMVRSYRRLGGPGVAFLGVDTTEVASVVKTFLSAKGVPYPIALAGPDAYNGFGVAYIPTTVVIDAHGIVRARWTGGLSEQRLATFVADARAGKNYEIAGPDETVVENLLAPAGYDFSGDASTVAVQVTRAKANADAAEAFIDTHGAGPEATVDFSRVESLEGALLLPAAQGSMRVAATGAERVAADRLLSKADGKLNRYADAVAALQEARTLAPSDAKLTLEIAVADYRLHDYPDGIAAATTYTAAVPNDSDGWDELGLFYQRAKKFSDAATAYERAIVLMHGDISAAKTPSDRIDAIANLADTSLDLANVYVALGDVGGATRAFATANEFGDRLDPKGEYKDLYRNVHERTQEGLIAVRMAHSGGKTALSVAPWTGADLPGSVASTLKYRLIVASAPNAKVDLRALGLRPGWVASFCADGLCSPMRVSFTLPESGVKTYEFQLVPPGDTHAHGAVTIRSSDGANANVPA
jgi:thiol-disulfide isomerase/thioredoxin